MDTVGAVPETDPGLRFLSRATPGRLPRQAPRSWTPGPEIELPRQRDVGTGIASISHRTAVMIDAIGEPGRLSVPS